METRATSIKCVHLGYDALIDMFQYENNSYELCDMCRGLILKRHKSFRGGIEGIEDEPHSDRSFAIKLHKMAEIAMNDWLMKGTDRLWKCKRSQSFPKL